MMSKLVARTVPSNLLFVGEILGGGKDFKPKMDELVRMNTTKANAVLADIDNFQTTRFAFYLAPSHLEHTLVFLRLSEDPLLFFFDDFSSSSSSPSSSEFLSGASKACRGVGPHMLPHFCQVLYEDLADVDDYVS